MREKRKDKNCFMINQPKYSPKSIHTKLLPQRQNPTTTKMILKTQLMLIGREVNRCFLFFSMLLIISDIFFMPYRSRSELSRFRGNRRFVFSRQQVFYNKYARSKNEGKWLICCKIACGLNLWRR
jgi:hypothetical protein